ncbi:MAG: SGNH/GDSL hydrolase family protein [Lachnospiraceae bacterium]|nr:SGNH/GDSL hydrolase family protein [Lachnospiraceae bacterium]
MTKKQAAGAVIFISIFLIILTTVTYIIRTNGEIKDIFTGFYAEEDDSLDVIMIGSSPVYPFYSASKLWGEYGITSYPLSSHVQRPSAALPLVKEAYKTQSPQVFVFEMRMYTMEDGDMESNMAYARGVTDNMKYSWNRIDAINRLVPDVSERYTYYFDIFKYHSNWKTMVLPEQIACFRYERQHPLKGFVIKDEVGPLEEERIPTCTGLTETMPIPVEQEERLYELLDYLKEQEQQALFIVSPYRIEPEEQMMFNYMKPIIASYGYEFVNMNEYYEEIGIDFTTDYYDFGGHVNTLGAEKCTAYLGKLLEQFDLPDKRGLEGYESWEESYEYYLEVGGASIDTINERIENQEYAKR